MNRPALFTSCTLTAIWWDGPPPLDGAFLLTRGGSAYRIEDVRQNPSGSYRLRCTRWPRDEVPDDAMTFEWRWSKRVKTAGLAAA